MIIEKYIKQVDLIDMYITKNICNLIKNKEELKLIKSNLYLLGYNNNNNKNSLEILIENNENKIINELIDYNFHILDYKNYNEQNLLMILILKEYFYEKISILIEKLPINFVIKIITDKDKNNKNFIDILSDLININKCFIMINIENKLLINILKILKNIYLLDNDDKIFLINNLCKNIYDENILLYIFYYLDIKNIDINFDENVLSSIDYLILKNYFKSLNYLIKKTNYIYFINLEDNILIKLFEQNVNIDNEKNILNIIFEIMKKSNITKIKNKNNQNILFKILENYHVKENILIKYINLFDIYEEDINGNNIYKLIKINYDDKSTNNILKNYKNGKKKIKIKINIKKLLKKSSIGLFNSDYNNNWLYTIIMLKKYKDLSIPYFKQNANYRNENYILLESSINDKFVNTIINIFFNEFNTFLPHIIIWKNKYNYYIDINLLEWLFKNKYKSCIYIKLSINLLNKDLLRHANIIIIDNINQIVERFEPYGEFNYYNSNDLNNFIISKISNPLNYKFKFVQPYPGFQTRSDEFNKFNKTIGDPYGYCLAWCFLYLEIKLMLLEKNIKMNEIDLINKYVINNFRKDFKIDILEGNLYLTFIRFYARRLDIEKNNLLIELNLDPTIYYYQNIKKKNYNIIINKINKSLNDILKIS